MTFNEKLFEMIIKTYQKQGLIWQVVDAPDSRYMVSDKMGVAWTYHKNTDRLELEQI